MDLTPLERTALRRKNLPVLTTPTNAQLFIKLFLCGSWFCTGIPDLRWQIDRSWLKVADRCFRYFACAISLSGRLRFRRFSLFGLVRVALRQRAADCEHRDQNEYETHCPAP